MDNFTEADALRSVWTDTARPRAVLLTAVAGVVLLIATALVGFVATRLDGVVAALAASGAIGLALLAGLFVVAALAIQFAEAIGWLLQRIAFGVFLAGVAGIVLAAWTPALLYERVDAAVDAARAAGHAGTLSVERLAEQAGPFGTLGGYGLYPLQFHLTRDVLALVGVISFVSLIAMFGIWWERKVAGRMQSRLGPMRVGGWHGWAQSLADGVKLLQKEDIFLAGADRALFKLAPYVAFMPALALFLALPFSSEWIGRDLDVGLIFILAMMGLGVLGVLLAGWASNNKWSMYGAMREACQMISYEIPLGFSLLIPIMTAGTLRLTHLGEIQSGGFHTWLAFNNPLTFAASIVFFVATLASCKRAPFDLPEAESELVAGYHTEYSGFRWALFFFAEYAEMFAVSALAVILFFGAWYSPLPREWGASLEHGPLWQQALHGLLFASPIWLVAKSLFLVYVQIWLRWTLPRIRLDQVMYACVQVLLPLTMVLLLANTFWELIVPDDSLVAVGANLLLAAIGAIAVFAVIGIVAWAYARRRAMVGSQAVEALPGA